MVIVARIFRTDVGKRCVADSAAVKAAAEATIKRGRIIVVLNRHVQSAVDAGIEIERRCQVESGDGAGPVEWAAEVENVAVGIEDVHPRIAHVRAETVHEFPYLDIESADGPGDREMGQNPRLGKIWLHDVVRRQVEQAGRVEVARVAAVEKL